MSRVRKHTPEDYKGEFNLLKMERNHILRVYKIARCDREITAKILDISIRSLYDRIESHNINQEMKVIAKQLKLKNRNNVEFKTN